MPKVHQNCLNLIQELENLPLLSGIYSNLKCVNVDPSSGESRGCFSLVFRGRDTLEDKPVALKFYSIDPAKMMDQYRIDAFKREPILLQTLLGKHRCMQLVEGLQKFEFNLSYSNEIVFTIPCLYFSVNWVDEEIDKFFGVQQSYSAIEKLRLFNEIVLAIETLHSNEIHHRDIKPDNLRAYQDALKRIVVAIDLGTAARSDSGSLKSDYDSQVGASGYSAPEAFCGLAGHRGIAPLTDIYALGCLLYQLFNKDLLFSELLRQNPFYGRVLSSLIGMLNNSKDLDGKVAIWRAHSKLLAAISRVQIDGPGNTLPAGIVTILNDLLLKITHPNFDSREKSLAQIRKRIWSAIKILENEVSSKRRIDQVRQRRLQRIEKARQKDERLATYLRKKAIRAC